MTRRPNSSRERTHVHTLGDVGKEDFLMKRDFWESQAQGGAAARFGV